MRDAVEIERKFLVRAEALPPLGRGERLSQAYLGFEPTVRVRLGEEKGAETAWLTVKGPGLRSRREVETELEPAAARALLELRAPGTAVVVKTRHRLVWAGRTWELDLFEGELAGLALAEVELPDAQAPVERPPWAGAEVTDDPRYQNANLARSGRVP